MANSTHASRRRKPDSVSHRLRGEKWRRFRVCAFEVLEDRRLLAFVVTQSTLFSTGGLRLTADFSGQVKSTSVDAGDLVIDGGTAGAVAASSVIFVDADTIEFFLPTLTPGSHTATIAAGTIQDVQSTDVDSFSRSFTNAAESQFTMKHSPRLQPGNAPLAAYPGGSFDRSDILWQTIPGGAGTQDSFTVEFRPAAATGVWQSVALNAAIDTGVEGRVVRSASITGLNYNADYEYRVRRYQGDVVADQYPSTFHTRLAAGDTSSFSFAAYGDSAAGDASGFRQVQGRINQSNASFAVLLGDNVYDVGSHPQSDARFDPLVNPEAAAWMAGHIDYLGLGNHDVATGAGLPAEQNYSVPIPVAGVTAPAAPPASERPEHSFSWDYGDVHFVTFDTNSLSDATRLDGLLKWATADLQASTARWKIVYGHHPLAGVPDKPESPAGNYYQQVVNRLQSAGVDLYMTGHSHTYAWTYPLTGQINGTATFEDHDDHDHFLAGVGLPQLVSGLGGKEVRAGSFDAFPFVAAGYTATTPVQGRLGFSKVDVTPTQMTVSYVAADNGEVIDSFVITKEADVQTAAFQQGANSYADAVDTFLHQNAPTTNNGAATSLKVDNDDPAGTGRDAQTLLRFDNIFGTGTGKIPLNAVLRSATLQLQTTNGGDGMNLHRMLGAWSAGDTWNSRVNGIQTDGVEAVAAPDTSTGLSQIGTVSFNVLASLQAWKANPSSNFGWVLVPTGADGVDFNSSEGAVRPKLIVNYVLGTSNTPPIAQNDGASTNQDTPVTIAVLGNDSDSDGDLLSLQAASTPTHGTATANANNTVTYSPAAGYYGSDSFTYTVSDGRGGTAIATVSVTIVPANLQTATFQQGVSGYAGTVDTFLQQNSSAVNNASATSLNVDSDDPVGTGFDVQTLLRFEDIFGASGVSTNALLQSATLQLQVTNAGSSVNFHRMLRSWSASDTWSSLTGGVQNDDLESTSLADVSTGSIAVGTLSINVLASLQAWQANPSANFGWAVLPTGTDGVDFYSSEGTTRPKLIVTYVPASNSPSIANDDAATTNEDSAVTIAVLTNDDDPNGDSLSITSVSQGASGTVLLNADDTVTYSPLGNFHGIDTFTYTIGDGKGGSAVGTVTVSVASVNDPPTANNDAATTNEDSVVTVAVLSNDGDIDGGVLSVQSASNGSKGTVVVNANGTLTYTPGANLNGSDTISYVIGDGQGGTATASVTVTINPVNDPPVANNDVAGPIGTTSVAIAVLANDTDIEASPLVPGIVSSPAGGSAVVNADGTITYTANAGFSGTDSFTYRVSDGAAFSNAATVTVTVVGITKFFVVDAAADKTFGYQAAGGYTAQAALAAGNSNARGIATNASGTQSWVLDGNKTVYVYNAAMNLLGSWLPGGLKSPTGISVKGSDLWIVDGNVDKVFLYAGAATRLTGTVNATRSFALNKSNGNPQDLVTDGTTVWVTESGTLDKVFVYQASNGANLGSWTLDPANGSPVGITLDPTVTTGSLWVVDKTADRVFEYAQGRSRRSGSQRASVSFALNTGNGSAEGIADPQLLWSGTATPASRNGGPRATSFDEFAPNVRVGSDADRRRDRDIAALLGAYSAPHSSSSSDLDSDDPNADRDVGELYWLDSLFNDGAWSE